MSLVLYLISVIFSAFFLAWGLSVNQSASLAEKGTGKRLWLEGFSMFLLTFAIGLQGTVLYLVV